MILVYSNERMKKKVLLVYAKNTSELLNRKSALGSYMHCLCSILEKNGFELSVNGIPFSRLNELNSDTSYNGAPASRVSAIKKLIPGFIKSFLKITMLFRRLDKLFSELNGGLKYDVILEFYTFGSNIGHKLSKRSGTPLVVVYDAPVLEEYEFFHDTVPFYRSTILKRQNATLGHAVGIVSYSNAVKAYLAKIIGDVSKVRIHQNVDFTRFEFIESKKIQVPINIGFIGSFLKWHNVELLIMAFVKLREQNIDAKLYLVGDGMERANIEEQVRASSFEKDIIMTGFLDGEQLYNYKKIFHIGVMPGSNWYGAPNKIFEYGAARMAVIAPATPTIADLFPVEVKLFQEHNVDELTRHLTELCIDHNAMEHYMKVLQEKIRNTYSETNTLQFYNSLLTHAFMK